MADVEGAVPKRAEEFTYANRSKSFRKGRGIVSPSQGPVSRRL